MLLGIVMLVSPVQPENIYGPMLDIPLPIETVPEFVPSPVQPEKAEFPTLVTVFGIVSEVRPVQPENAESPTLVTLLPIVSDVIVVFPLNPEPIVA